MLGEHDIPEIQDLFSFQTVAHVIDDVIDEGGSIQHVRADTDLRAHLTAAWLRFALPPEPPSAEEARP